ncbi:hypothetical protein OG429_01270 [Streptomyces sp. NBC_00190]|uniref:hypothetical protein n=1 Tax=unclassified Streptomyces TaxID=2593676 RepID=UPI002E298B9E|nr:hypothetical protein [Streptomyces sp. NBC_00190]WSZ38087.1 hypothetical protein OG239_04260 [Streptomyces sp. NBC_00868]
MKPILLSGAGVLVRPAMARAARAVVCAGAVGVFAGGCGASAARVDGARAAGERFERALASGNHEAACRLLAPETSGQLEQDEGKTCREAVGAEELPMAGAVRTTEVYGRQAMLRLVGDTLFLSQFSGGWKVVAAGCTPQGEQQPYRCVLKGG